MPKCGICRNDFTNGVACPRCGYGVCNDDLYGHNAPSSWMGVCPKCGARMGPVGNPLTNVSMALWNEWGGKIALVIGLIILIVVLVLFFWFIVSGVLGGVIGFLFCWLNKKGNLVKIANHWVFILLIALILSIIFAVIGNLVFPPANYITTGLIGFVIGYLASLKQEKKD